MDCSPWGSQTVRHNRVTFSSLNKKMRGSTFVTLGIIEPVRGVSKTASGIVFYTERVGLWRRTSQSFKLPVSPWHRNK